MQWYDKPARGGFGYSMSREAMLETAAALKIEVTDFA